MTARRTRSSIKPPADTKCDNKYEFNAPKYHDFQNSNDDNNENVDNWFETKPVSPASARDEEQEIETFDLLPTTPKKPTRPRRSTMKKNTTNISDMCQKIIKAANSTKKETKRAKAVLQPDPSIRYMPTRSVKPLTIPKDFNFSKPKTKTLKSTAMSKAKAVAKKKTVKKQGELTIVEPFKFHTSLKKFGNDVTSTKSPFKPLAVRVKEFEEGKLDPVNPARRSLRLMNRLKLTQPKSPFLTTKLRQKPINILPTEEMEIKKMEALEPFKAKPINPKILDKPLGVPQLKRLAPTIPCSPAIVKPKPTPEPSPEPEHLFKANPIKIAKPFQPQLEHKHTEPLPIHLAGEEIRHRKLEQFQKQQEKELEMEKEKRKFKAQPMPSDSPENFPVKKAIHVTEPKPFNLLTDVRGELHQQHFAEVLQSELEEEENKMHFKANPVPQQAPFIPKKSTKPPTEVENIVLHSEERVEERRKFDQQLKQKELEELEMKKQRELQQKEAEKKQIRTLRSRLVHHANPIRHFNTVNVQPSQKKLTEPHSPMIGEKRRRMMAARSENKHIRK